VFGFVKVRYRGLAKNTHRLVVICALPNLFMARQHLLRCQQAYCAANLRSSSTLEASAMALRVKTAAVQGSPGID
jgi:hypothetical protein